MNNKIAAAGAVAIIVVVAFSFYRLGARNAEPPATQGATDEKRVLYWRDPMHPEQHFDKPGKSPFMDMELVPVYADQAAQGGVLIDPRVQQRLGVRTALVERRSFSQTITVAGNVEYNENDVADVQARAAGYIERVHARTPMQSVVAGQVLAELYAPDWVAVQEDYLAVLRMQSGESRSLAAAALQRMRLAGMSEEQIKLVGESQAVQARLSVRAPIAGVITALNARDGMSVMNGAPLFRINGLSSVWLYAEVPEANVAAIKPGAAVTAQAAALPGATLTGHVLTLLPDVSAATRTARARIELKNPRRALLPGMFVTAYLAVEPRSALVAPSEALIATGTRSVVIVADEDGRFAPVDVRIGVESEGLTEIRSGLSEGQRIVVSAQFLIDSEANLKAAMTRMTEEPSPQPSSTMGEGVGKTSPVVGEVAQRAGEGPRDSAAANNHVRHGEHK